MGKMMMTTTILVAAATMGAPGAPAPGGAEGVPTAEDILDAYVAATGGQDAYADVETMRMDGVYTGSHLVYYDADELPFTSFLVGADRWHRSWPQSGIGETMLREEGWLYYPDQGVLDQPANQHAFFLRELPLARADWRSFWDEAHLLGPTTFDGAPAMAVALETENGALRVTRWFSRETGLLLASETPAGDGTATVRYGDYRAVGDLLLPFEAIVDIGPDTHHEFRVKDMAANVAVDPALFQRPQG